METADIGLIGLAVMGENLALNFEGKGYAVAVYNRRSPGREHAVDRFVEGRGRGKRLVGTHSIRELVESVRRPRRILMMIRAGEPVDEVIGQLMPYLERGDVVIETVAREYLTPLKNAGVDTLILGCTHYPLLTDVIGDVMGPGVELVSAGEESAFELKRMLKARELRADERRRGETEFYVSDRVEDFERTASLFLQEDLRHTARRIDIERY